MDDDNPIVLSFHNTLVRQSDLRLLEGPHWLNDTIIGFFFEYLENEACKDAANRVAFVCPEIVQFLKRADSTEVGPFLDSMDLGSKEFVFMAVNNSQSRDSPGGSHWSLLVFHVPTSTFFHYDSYGDFNSSSARRVMRSVSSHLCSNSVAKFIEEDSPQQTNSYDCGIHVVMNANILVRHYLYGVPFMWYDEDAPAESRKLLRELIVNCSRESDLPRYESLVL